MAIDLNDKSGNGNTLSNQGVAEFTDTTAFAQSEIASDFGSVDADYFNANDSTSLSITGALSLELWFNADSNPTNDQLQAFISKYDGSGGGSTSYLFANYNNNGTQTLALILSNNGTDTESYLVDTAPEIGTWNHYAVTWEPATKAIFYKNGLPLADGTAVGTTTSLNDSNMPTRLGCRSDSAVYPLDGQADEFRVWSTTRSAFDISYNYNKHYTGDKTDLAAYWPLESLKTTSLLNLTSKRW